MTKSAASDFSTTAANNTIIDGNNADENCPMSGQNNVDRGLAAAMAGALTYVLTSGTDTYTATLVPAPDALATNFQYLIGFVNPNTSTTPTINVGFGAKTIVLQDGATALVPGSLNGCHILEYDGTNMRVLNPALVGAPIADATNGGLNIAANKINLKPADLLTKTTPTTSDSILIMDAANSNAATTATLPKVMAALFSPISNSLGGDVALNNTGTFFDGPSIAQGTTGTWFASGTVTVVDSLGASDFHVKLWDGATVIASAVATSAGGSDALTISLSGYLASPAANIRMSVKSVSNTSGSIKFNATGNSKDSTITAIRIA